MISWVAGFILPERGPGFLAWVPTLIYTLAAVIDYLDGYLARLQNHSTHLGELLDNELDALGVLTAVTLAISYGSLPIWFLPIGLARYLFQFGLRSLERRGRRTFRLPASRSRRPIAGLTMGFLCAILWPIAKPPVSVMAGVLFLLPFAVSFGRDWLVVAGSWDPASPSYRWIRHWVKTLVQGWLPVLLRILVLLTVLKDSLNELAGIVDSPLSEVIQEEFVLHELEWMISGSVVLAGSLILLGIAGRFAAFFLVFPLGIPVALTDPDPSRVLGLLAVLGVLILGTGKLSIWQPAVKLFTRRAGDVDIAE
jgi:CDP-diacylglycerol--glycerol-3-phosphate 3-phosphatidyltransferase